MFRRLRPAIIAGSITALGWALYLLSPHDIWLPLALVSAIGLATMAIVAVAIVCVIAIAQLAIARPRAAIIAGSITALGWALYLLSPRDIWLPLALVSAIGLATMAIVAVAIVCVIAIAQLAIARPRAAIIAGSITAIFIALYLIGQQASIEPRQPRIGPTQVPPNAELSVPFIVGELIVATGVGTAVIVGFSGILPFLLLPWIRRKRIIIPQPRLEETLTAARVRRAFLLENIQRLEASFEEVSQEILEFPPDLGAGETRRLTRSEAIAEFSSLVWQLNDDGFLLLGRVVDLISLFARQLGIQTDQIATAVKLQRRRNWLWLQLRRRRDVFPYLVVVETNDAPLLTRVIRRYQSWIGIGVAVQRPTPMYAFGKCQAAGPAEQGCVGGYVSSNQFGLPLMVTCAHVLAEHCMSVKFRSELKPVTLEPDVALLNAGNPCFPFSYPGHEVAALSADSALLLHNRNQSFVRVPGPSRRGQIQSVALWASYEGRVHKFPHVEIGPDVKIWMDLFSWPLWSRFSKRGHSGSWVIDQQGDGWLGLLVGGNKFYKLTYAALAYPLMDFLRRAANLAVDTRAFVGRTR